MLGTNVTSDQFSLVKFEFGRKDDRELRLWWPRLEIGESEIAVVIQAGQMLKMLGTNVRLEQISLAEVGR